MSGQSYSDYILQGTNNSGIIPGYMQAYITCKTCKVLPFVIM